MVERDLVNVKIKDMEKILKFYTKKITNTIIYN